MEETFVSILTCLWKTCLKSERFNRGMLEEGLEAMLPKSLRNDKYKYYDSMHPVLGTGTTKMRMQFGDTISGKNLYGIAVNRVLNRRASFKRSIE